MSILQEVGRRLAADDLSRLREATRDKDAQLTALRERMADLELALEDVSWLRVTFQAEQEFSREGLRQINRLARVMWLKSPLIKRGVGVQTLYVFGQGVNVYGRVPAVNAVVQKFLDDAKNQAELTSQQASMQKEMELQLFSNLFFVFFVNRSSGRVRVRTIQPDEVEEIICNPEDGKEPWFYRRTWQEQKLDMDSGGIATTQRTAYYPDWRYTPRVKPVRIGPHEVRWETPVYHVKVNALSDMRFGVSEVYAAIDWAKAYKEFLEDWVTIVRAYSRFAWQVTTKGGKAGIAAAKGKLATTYGSSPTAAETNPPPVTGAAFIAGEGTQLSPIRTAGATTSAEDGRRLLLMVAATTGLPESFFGDVSVGTLATAKSLDRPTELQMRARQMLWADVLKGIIGFVIVWAVRAPSGPLHALGSVVEEDDGTPLVTLRDPETGQALDLTVDVDYPPILEHDVQARVGAIVDAATLQGHPPAGTMDDRTLARLLLTALGEDDVDDLLDRLYPDEGRGQPVPLLRQDRLAKPGESGIGEQGAEATFTEAVRELREAVRGFVEKYGAGS